MYRVPLEAPLVDQGSVVLTDVFKPVYELGLGVIMTPECDIAQSKAQFIQVAGVATPNEVYEWLGVTSRGDARPEVKRLMRGQHFRWHYLHPNRGVNGLELGAFVDFQFFRAIPVDSVQDDRVVGQIKSPWNRDLAFRYVSCMGRVGTPKVDDEEWDQWQRDLVQIIPTM